MRAVHLTGTRGCFRRCVVACIVSPSCARLALGGTLRAPAFLLLTRRREPDCTALGLVGALTALVLFLESLRAPSLLVDET